MGWTVWLVCVQVSKYFSEVFKELVPEGKALLIMKRSVDAVRNAEINMYIYSVL